MVFFIYPKTVSEEIFYCCSQNDVLLLWKQFTVKELGKENEIFGRAHYKQMILFASTLFCV